MTTPERSHIDFSMAPSIPIRAKALSDALPTIDIVRIPVRSANVSAILQCVCESFLISVADLTGKVKHRNISEARIVTYWLLRALGGLSYPEVGVVLKKDHTSAISGFKRCVRRRALEPSFLAFTDELQAAVAARMGGEAE
jgi:chromosomal replication initiation ATPase DnaA